MKIQDPMRSISFAVSTVLLLLLLSSCGKVYDKNGLDWEPDVPPSDSVFNREIQVLNFAVNLNSGLQPTDVQDPVFFSLERVSPIATAYRSTERWDIALSGLSRNEISANNGARAGFGYGTSAIGGIVVLDSAYSEVTVIPEDSKFQLPGVAGLDDQGAFGAGLGHVAYTFFSNFIRPELVSGIGSPNPDTAAKANQYIHMMYGLSENLVKAFPDAKNMQGAPLRPRTVIIRTAAGNYAKFETQSFYKDILDPKKMRRGSDILLALSFRYMVVKAAERRFGFVPRHKPLKINLSTNTGLILN